MKPLLFLMLVVLLTGCSAGDSSGPGRQPGRPFGTPRDPGWTIEARRAIFSPDNRFVLISYFSSSGTPLADMIPVYDLTTGQKVHTFSKDDLSVFLALPGTAHILAMNKNGEVNIWDMTNGKRIGKGPKFPHGAFPGPLSQDGNLGLIGWGERRKAKDNHGEQPEEEYAVEEVWDIKQGKALQRWESERGIGAAVFSPDGKWLFARSSQTRRQAVFDIATGKEVNLSASHEEWKNWPYPLGPWPLAFSPDGKLAVSEGGEGQKRQMFLWDWKTGKIVQRLDCQAKGKLPGYYNAEAVTFASDGKRLTAGGRDLALRCWDIATGKEIWAVDMVPPQGSLTLLDFSPDGSRALTATGCWIERGTHCLHLRVWDCTDGKLLRELPPLPDGSGR